jgi:hypothetical protein
LKNLLQLACHACVQIAPIDCSVKSSTSVASVEESIVADSDVDEGTSFAAVKVTNAAALVRQSDDLAFDISRMSIVESASTDKVAAPRPSGVQPADRSRSVFGVDLRVDESGATDTSDVPLIKRVWNYGGGINVIECAGADAHYIA